RNSKALGDRLDALEDRENDIPGYETPADRTTVKKEDIIQLTSDSMSSVVDGKGIFSKTSVELPDSTENDKSTVDCTLFVDNSYKGQRKFIARMLDKASKHGVRKLKITAVTRDLKKGV